jgi:hypothetical protein
MSIWIKLAMIAALLAGLAAGVWKIRHGGYTAGLAEARAECTAAKQAAEETGRILSLAKTKANQGVDLDYQTFKARAAAAGRATADSLRRADDAAARASADPATECRADDPRPTIARECRSALKQVDDHARSLAGQVAGLQGYASEVCVSP